MLGVRAASWLCSSSFRSCSSGFPGNCGFFLVPVSRTIGTEGRGDAWAASSPLAASPTYSLLTPSGSVGISSASAFCLADQMSGGSLELRSLSRRPSPGSSHFGGILKSKNLHNRPAQRMSHQDVRSGHLCCVQKSAQLDCQLLRISGMSRRGLIGFS